jgi:hypothetical protein
MRFRAEIVVAGMVTLWGILSLASRVLHRRRLGHWPIRFRIAPPDASFSVEASQNRRNSLLNHLRRYSEGAGVSLEFIETPPGFESIPLREYGQRDTARFWLASRLEIQLEKQETLLLERVTDAFVCLERLQRITREDFPYLIRLERLPARRRQELFPWKVVVSCDAPNRLFPHFSDPETRNWLGIGIDFTSRNRQSMKRPEKKPPEATPTAAVAQGRCTIGTDGKEGSVGGMVGDGEEIFGITARHVLSSSCQSIAQPTSDLPMEEFTEDSPDVAFIRLESGCFDEIIGRESVEITRFASQDDLELAVRKETKYRKMPMRDELDGIVVTASSSGFKLGTHFYRGPHFQMTPTFVERMGIIFPINKKFSKPGDSGAWVFDFQTGQWIGMIVGGYEPPVICSVGISAEFIFRMYSHYQATRTSTSYLKYKVFL